MLANLSIASNSNALDLVERAIGGVFSESVWRRWGAIECFRRSENNGAHFLNDPIGAWFASRALPRFARFPEIPRKGGYFCVRVPAADWGLALALEIPLKNRAVSSKLRIG
jgi:hypothetical protein